MALKWIACLLFLAATVYGAICLGVWRAQRDLVYAPSHEVVPPTDLKTDAVHLLSSDGLHLEAWIVTADASTSWVLYCHGNGGNMGTNVDQLVFWHRRGYNVMAFDYRGYGNSEGTPTEAGLYRDAEAAWTYLTATRHVPPARIVVFGESLGGGVACELAARHPPGALIVLSTFSSLVDAGKALYPWLPVGALATERFPSADRVARLTVPKLFIHSPSDEVVPFALGQALFAAAAQPKTFYQTTGAHNESPLDREAGYGQAIGGFLAAVVRF